jgi:PAS domain S-box-containing protein
MFSAGSLAAGWTLPWPGVNGFATLRGFAFLGAALLNIAAVRGLTDGAGPRRPRPRKTGFLCAYGGASLCVAILILGAGPGRMPAFFAEGEGATPLREVVLSMAAILYAVSGVFALRLYLRRHRGFLSWYGLALLLVAMGLAGALTAVGGYPLGWWGGCALYLGGIYFFVGIVAAVREARMSGISVGQALADCFREWGVDYRHLVEGVKEAVISIDRAGRVVLWNPAAESAFGYVREEAIGSLLADLIGTDGSFARPFEPSSPEGGAFAREAALRRKDGSLFFGEVSGSVTEAAGRRIATYLIRDATGRWEAEEALRQSEERLRLAQAAGRVGVFDWDLKTNRLVMMPELGDFFGVRGGAFETNHKAWAKQVHPDDLPGLSSLFWDWLESRRTEEPWEYRFFRQNGEMRWRLLRGRIIRGKDGVTPVRLIGTSLDITDRKRRENLLDAQRNLALALAASVALEEGLRLCCETAIEVSEMDGGGIYLADEASGDLRLVFHRGLDKDLADMVSLYRADSPRTALVMAGEPVYVPYEKIGEFLGKERSLLDRSMSGAVIPVRSGDRIIGSLNVVSYRRDVVPAFARIALETIAAQMGSAAARLRATEALRVSEEKYRMLFEDSRDAIMIATWEGEITEVNRAFLDLLDYTRAEVRSLNTREIYSDFSQERDLLGELHGTGSVQHFQVDLKKKDGTRVICILTASVKFSRTGEATGYQGFLRDVTQHRRLEREVMEISNAERARIGQDLHDSLGQLVTGIALKSKSLARALTKHLLPEAADAERLTELANQAIDQARDLAKGLLPVDFEAGGVCPALRELARRTSSIYGVSCSVTCTPESIGLDELTAMQLYRIAQEGSVNAVKHGRARHIEIRLDRGQRTITLTVEDDGVGLSKAPSTGGLGLRLIRYRAQMINGSLNIRERTEGGTVVECIVRTE